MARPNLRALSRLLGVLDSYLPVGGGRPVATSDAARVALLAAMGVDASTERSSAREHARILAERAGRPLEPIRVVRQDAARAVPVRVESDRPVSLDWELELRREDGTVHRRAGRRRFSPLRPSRIDLGVAVPIGDHELTVRLGDGRTEQRSRQRLVVTPGRATTVDAVLGARRVFGLGVNLYSVRRREDLGVGDLAALASLVDWTARRGGAFVGVNPLQAQRIRDGDVSPYSPSSRVFGSSIYVDPEAVPELAGCREARALLASRPVRELVASLRGSARVEYEAALDLKERLLRIAHRRFARASPRRRREFERFVERGGEPLRDFATFEALSSRLRAEGRHRGSWRTWPEELRDVRSPAVARFREEHPEEVELHLFIQFELARQLDALQGRARKRGLAIGLYHDLPVGVSADGADAWIWGSAFAPDARIGAPPDDFQIEGQDWGLPPLVPSRLPEIGYAYWIEIVRAAFRAAGAVRIDHAMGLARQYWVTGSGRERLGAYVAQPFEDLMGIVALESVRSGALVVGEDLGTVPRGFRRRMARFGALSMKILYFERTASGGFRAREAYPRGALAAANTHDLATLPAFWAGRDLELEAELASGAGAVPAADKRERRERDRRALRRRLALAGTWPAEAEALDPGELLVAVHRFLATTPSALLSVSLDDVAGETAPVNLPGVPADVYPSWTRRMERSLEELRADPRVRTALEAAARPGGEVTAKRGARPAPRGRGPERAGGRRRPARR